MSVRRSFGFVLWATGFFNVMMQKFYFVFAAALLQKVDLVMLSMQMKFMVKTYHLSCQVNIDFYIDLYFC